MPAAQASAPEQQRATRRRRGDYPTPPDLIARVLDGVMPEIAPRTVVRVCDPACGDGRFLAAAAARIAAAGAIAVVRGVEIDPARAVAARRVLATAAPTPGDVRIDVADALRADWAGAHFDLVVGNPPFLSQLAAATTRGGASNRGGGPLADVAAEFLDLAVQLARPGGGRVGLVLPQSILASRDVAGIRRRVDAAAELFWSWWSPDKVFDADVIVCALGFERHRVDHRPDPDDAKDDGDGDDNHQAAWTAVILDELGVPRLPPLRTAGTLGDRARLSSDYRDVYYGLVPAVSDAAAGPPLVTSGSIDPLQLRWGTRPIRFARRRLDAPRVDVELLDARMRRWADGMQTPKVLVANQTAVLECVADADGRLLPAVPVVTARPTGAADPLAIAAVLTSSVATGWVWQRTAGTGLAASMVRIGPRLLAELPWPAGPLDDAIAAAGDGDVARCGQLVDAAYGVAGAAGSDLQRWWRSRQPHR